ncbi:MAG: VOC family protein, partial [Steroidobacteraceae bacterium]
MLAALLAACTNSTSAPQVESIVERVDHLMFAVADLDEGIAQIEAVTGVRAQLGGAHPGRGSHNALLSLGLR